MIRLIIDGPRDPFYNMAIDEAMARLRRSLSVDTVRLYAWSRTAVSLGRRQDVSRAISLEAARRLGVEVVRRPTGGAAVLHVSRGEITYSVVLGSDHSLYSLDVAESAARIAMGVAEALRSLGIEARTRGSSEEVESEYCYLSPAASDVLVRGVKVSGSAQRREWGALLQHGTLILRYDAEASKVIIDGEREAVRGIWELGYDVPISRLYRALAEGFSRVLGELTPSSLTPEELEMAEELYKKKYSTEDWNLRGISWI